MACIALFIAQTIWQKESKHQWCCTKMRFTRRPLVETSNRKSVQFLTHLAVFEKNHKVILKGDFTHSVHPVCLWSSLWTLYQRNGSVTHCCIFSLSTSIWGLLSWVCMCLKCHFNTSFWSERRVVMWRHYTGRFTGGACSYQASAGRCPNAIGKIFFFLLVALESMTEF